jgi:YHS domain-containing protein
MRSSLSVLLLASASLVAACGGSSPQPSSPAGAVGTLKAPGEAKVGDRSKCPVSGEDFVVSETSPKVEYQGKTYYFCCPGCAKKFEGDPQKFLGKPSA